MKSYCCNVWVVGLGLLVFAWSQPALAICVDPPGDVNASGTTDVVDVQCATLVTLWSLGDVNGPAPSCVNNAPERADLDCNKVTNVVDVLVVVQQALTSPLAIALDADGDGCLDSCGPKPQSYVLNQPVFYSAVPKKAQSPSFRLQGAQLRPTFPGKAQSTSYRVSTAGP